MAWLPPRSQPAVVLQVVSKEYTRMELNFIYQMELHSAFSRHNLLLLCLDEESSKILMSELGIRCAEVQHEEEYKRRDVWSLRMQVASCLLLAGYDVLLSDADAIWLKDPMDSISDLGANDSNVVASRGRMPKKLYLEWGSTVCFGFVLLRARGTGISTLIDAMAMAIIRSKDDQNAINSALSSLGIKWDPKSDMGFANSTRRGRGTVERLGDGDEKFVVTLLPHATFTRLCNQTPISGDTVVAHCHSFHKGEHMAVWMKKANLWKNFDFDPVVHQDSLS